MAVNSTTPLDILISSLSPSLSTTVTSSEGGYLWMIIAGFIVSFVLAFGIGANDVANSFGTSVGSKVLTLLQACILATIFETLGAVLLGSKVSDTIRKGIIEVEPYRNQSELLMVGNVAALTGSCAWLFVATLLRLPVSGTHSIVGATIGFALVAQGTKGINWMKMGLIIGSWFVSPLLSGAVSTLIFFIVKRFILSKVAPLEPGLKFLPAIYAITIIINMFSIFYDGPEILGFDKIPLWGIFIISFGAGIITCLVVKFAVVPWLRKRIRRQVYFPASSSEEDCRQLTNAAWSANSSRSSSCGNSRRPSQEKISHNPATEFPGLGVTAENVKTPPVDEKLAMKYSSDANCIITSVVNPNAELPQSTIPNGCLKSAQESLMPSNEVKYPTKDREADKAKETNSNSSLLNDSKESSSSQDSDDSRQKSRDAIKDAPETVHLFSFLQVLTAVFGAFAHGGNDVSNAIGPLAGLWLVYQEGHVMQKAATPLWILAYGGIGISIGLWIWGRRVIKTLGEDLTKITPSSGFCIEIGSALTVLIASNSRIPISTTHCKVGSVVSVGHFRSRENVDWKLFRNILLAWIVTLPIAGGISAGVFAGLRLLVL